MSRAAENSMVGTLLKIPLKLVKLQIKLALLPVRTAVRLVRHCTESDARPDDPYSRPSADPIRPLEPSAPAQKLEVAPSDLMKQIDAGDELILIDVRQPQELANSGLIEGSLHIPTQDLPHRIDDLNKEQTTIVYCHLGSRSMDAAMFLREKGFEDVKSLGGGIVGWESDGGSIASL